MATENIISLKKTIYNILLVEDNRVNQALIKAFLNKYNHNTDIANNGIEALHMIKQRPYDLVLMDIQMPKMDGLEATSHIRAMAAPICDTPIIAVSANALNIEKQAYLDAGMNGFLAKPVRQVDLMKMIDDVMAEHDKKMAKNLVKVL
jgi:CheY-like chemotaxis protein